MYFNLKLAVFSLYAKFKKSCLACAFKAAAGADDSEKVNFVKTGKTAACYIYMSDNKM